MGADMADINNDGYPEVFVTDMLPDEEYRLKTTASFENINIYTLKQKRGFYHQYMQNSLQLNDQNQRFREIAYFSGVAASDWSWGALMFDADNDRYADIFVCNGIYHDVIDQDFIDFFANEMMQEMAITGQKEDVDAVINKMPSNPIVNKAFRNKGNLQFEEMSENWGFDLPSFSNGSAYGDLDNDGDLDLVINNVNQAAFVYQNHSEQLADHHYLSVALKGPAANPSAIGAKVSVFAAGEEINRQLIPTRGFQSSVDYRLSFGLGTVDRIDSLRVVWPDRSRSIWEALPVDTFLVLTYEVPRERGVVRNISPTTFLKEAAHPFEAHQEDNFIDFYFERNIPLKTSHEGPHAARADVDGDGLEDIYIGGAVGQAGQLYLQKEGSFKKQEQAIFEEYANFEDTALLFFD
ncbi:MAG: CRTAC1 family protein, partial [Bacteroidota bacterium]